MTWIIMMNRQNKEVSFILAVGKRSLPIIIMTTRNYVNSRLLHVLDAENLVRTFFLHLLYSETG